jgi:Zn-dependent alcohol dehydrogenase
MRIRAAILEEFGVSLTVQELDIEESGTGEVLVRLEAYGVCDTDLYAARAPIRPSVLGHEGAGVVERVGDGVTLVAVTA